MCIARKPNRGSFSSTANSRSPPIQKQHDDRQCDQYRLRQQAHREQQSRPPPMPNSRFFPVMHITTTSSPKQQLQQSFRSVSQAPTRPAADERRTGPRSGPSSRSPRQLPHGRHSRAACWRDAAADWRVEAPRFQGRGGEAWAKGVGIQLERHPGDGSKPACDVVHAHRRNVGLNSNRRARRGSRSHNADRVHVDEIVGQHTAQQSEVRPSKARAYRDVLEPGIHGVASKAS